MEIAEYETVWHGAAWRDAPQPVLATADTPRRRYTTTQPTWTGRELVYAVLESGGWHSVKGVIARTGDRKSVV